jgi:hypothetical protein
LREIGLSDKEVAATKEMWSRGMSLIYHWAICCRLEGRTNPSEINMSASPEVRKASAELEKMANFGEWKAPSPDETQRFIEERGLMNEEVRELINDYRYFLQTGDIRRRAVIESLRDQVD